MRCVEVVVMGSEARGAAEHRETRRGRANAKESFWTCSSPLTTSIFNTTRASHTESNHGSCLSLTGHFLLVSRLLPAAPSTGRCPHLRPSHSLPRSGRTNISSNYTIDESIPAVHAGLWRIQRATRNSGASAADASASAGGGAAGKAVVSIWTHTLEGRGGARAATVEVLKKEVSEVRAWARGRARRRRRKWWWWKRVLGWSR